MVFLLLLLVLPAYAAVPQDLSGKILIFPEETNTANVKLIPSTQSFDAVTVCLRVVTDLSRSHALFSLATSSDHNGFLIYKSATRGMVLYVKNSPIGFQGYAYQMNMWHSICVTWESTSCLAQLWVDGMPSVKKYIHGTTITNPIILVGQDQDSHGGGFDADQSFVGMMSDVHMWDHMISPCEIQKFTDDLNFTPGNALNWRALEFQTTGRVAIEDKDKACKCH